MGTVRAQWGPAAPGAALVPVLGLSHFSGDSRGYLYKHPAPQHMAVPPGRRQGLALLGASRSTPPRSFAQLSQQSDFDIKETFNKLQ